MTILSGERLKNTNPIRNACQLSEAAAVFGRPPGTARAIVDMMAVLLSLEMTRRLALRSGTVASVFGNEK